VEEMCSPPFSPSAELSANETPWWVRFPVASVGKHSLSQSGVRSFFF